MTEIITRISEYVNTTTITGAIVFVFFFYLAQELLIEVLRHKISKAVNDSHPLDVLAKSKLKTVNEAYRSSINIEHELKKKSNMPAAEFFSMSNTCKAYWVNLRQLDTASGTLVGLGLLGTFWGLTVGISNFQGSNTEQIQTSIQMLLDGMSTAFVTSLAGMFFSLLYIPFDKFCRNRLAKALYTLTEKLDNEYYIDDVTLAVQNQKVMFTDLYMNMKNILTAQTQLIMEQAKSDSLMLQNKLVYKNANNEEVSIGNAIREILAENAEQSRALKSFSTDLADNLINLSDTLSESFEHRLAKPLQEKFVALIENVDTRTRLIIEHIDSMSAQLASPATDMIQGIVDELKESMVHIVSEFKQNISSSTSTELEGLVAQLGTATNTMAEFPRNMANMSSALDTTINEVKKAVADISSTSANTSSAAMQQMQEQVTLATGAISSAINEVRDVMGNLTQSSQQQSDEMTRKLAEAAERMGQFLDGTVNNLSTSVHSSMEEIAKEIGQMVAQISTTSASTNETAMKQMQEQVNFATDAMNTTLNEVKNVVSGMTQSSQQQNDNMMGNLSSATEKMSQFLDETVANLSASVTNSMKDITADVNDKQAELLELQESTTSKTKELLSTFNQGLEKLEKMNEYIAGTMDMFQQAQGHITGSTEHLKDITADMKSSTELFNRTQTEYSNKMQLFQQSSQNSLQSISAMMEEAGTMSGDYAEKFEVIKSGLSTIFGQIQSGLTEYSKTVQSSTQEYLNKYATNLTNTTDALASTISQQQDVIIELTEAINSFKRR